MRVPWVRIPAVAEFFNHLLKEVELLLVLESARDYIVINLRSKSLMLSLINKLNCVIYICLFGIYCKPREVRGFRILDMFINNQTFQEQLSSSTADWISSAVLCGHFIQIESLSFSLNMALLVLLFCSGGCFSLLRICGGLSSLLGSGLLIVLGVILLRTFLNLFLP